MKEEKLIELLNSFDDDLIDQEIDKLLEGTEVDMKSIKEKAYKKLNGNKKIKKEKLPYIAAACIGILSISTVYASEISEALKSFLNKTPIYSTIVDGDGYYLKESYKLDDKIKLESVMVSDRVLEMELSGLNESELDMEAISVISKDDTNTVYHPVGYSIEKGKHFFSFANKTEKNYNIKPFKDFKLIIGEKSYDISLEKANKLNLSGKIYTDNSGKNGMKGVNIGAKLVDKNRKTNLQIVTSLEDKDLKLSRFGRPNESKLISEYENLGSKGINSSAKNAETDKIYVFDENNNKYELKVPEDSKGTPVTIFETDAPKDKNLTLKIPSVIAYYEKEFDSFNINIPKEGEIALNKEIDFKMQKVVAKSIKRTSPTSAEIEFDLNTMENKNINIRTFDFYSGDIKKMYSEFEGNKAIMKIEFDKDIDKAKIKLSWPEFEMNGNWEIEMK
ncbi:hypothetical protein Curi_c20500 [Gottschalkia acidurici 9a]|uniref:DUF4179 domain-containing protein n=1 Tax=Gottschalkia acidurici (strain ATCC 7906 / DSM 604 / BCRC 14475 / CIP 104303 / KCTC 5404 / NCIMB 10678 / 9a) TaxID=1128398 RepID=K0B0J3_GOTA9|nr:hypothetical protein [Gottschalkia acidurici]AFS79054.1 hypothetical protein Curi_c20500 [Gottschalkia acidurici 9a]